MSDLKMTRTPSEIGRLWDFWNAVEHVITDPTPKRKMRACFEAGKCVGFGPDGVNAIIHGTSDDWVSLSSGIWRCYQQARS